MADVLNRRRFVGATSLGSGLVALAAPAVGANSNSRLKIGIIGPGRRGFGTHLKSLVRLRSLGQPIDITGVCDVYQVHRDRAVQFIHSETGVRPKSFVDYHDLLAEDVDAICIATPDHWHALQIQDSLQAGKHVYCEKPMTHTQAEAMEVLRAWRASGKVMQVGVQLTSLPIWDRARQWLEQGKCGKIVQFQTESARNSKFGMSRHNVITKEMTPKSVDWKRFLGVEQGLAPDQPFDRAVFGQWRCYWPFGYGMFSDLFVHRVTGMLKATGLRFPGRVVGAGGIFMEYDDRQVPDVGTVVADFHEGVQGLISSTMVAEERKLGHLIRGHHGLVEFDRDCVGNSGKGSCEFIPERPQVTLDSSLRPESIAVKTRHDVNTMHFANFLEAIDANDPQRVNNDPELGAAAITVVNLAVRSYREGKVFHVDRKGNVQEGDASWADRWERRSAERAEPSHIPGWQAGQAGSQFFPPDYQRLAGPWKDGQPPSGNNE